MMTIEEKRRELFESWWSSSGMEKFKDTAWAAYNAALDAVVIELPRQYEIGGLAGDAHDRAVAMCRNAIETAGVKVKP